MHGGRLVAGECPRELDGELHDAAVEGDVLANPFSGDENVSLVMVDEHGSSGDQNSV